MPEYLAPGVYMEEIEIGPKPIEGVGTSTAAFVGECERGPTIPTLVTGTEQYRRLFGSYEWTTLRPKADKPEEIDEVASTSLMRQTLEGFFANGGKRCFVTRIAGNSKLASKSIAVARGAPSMSSEEQKTVKTLEEKVLEAEGKVKDCKDEKKAADEAFTKASAGDKEAAKAAQETAKKNLTGAQSDLETANRNLANFRKELGSGPVFAVEALGLGSWGNKIVLKISKASAEMIPGVDATKMFRAVVQYWEGGEAEETVARDAGSQSKSGPTPWIEEVYDNLSIDPKSPDYVVRRVNGYSNLIGVSASEDPEVSPDVAVSSKDLDEPKGGSFRIWLEGGADAEKISLPDYKGDVAPDGPAGLAALEAVDEVAIVCAPNAHDIEGLPQALVTHCENLKDRFAVLQAPEGPQDMGSFVPPTDSMFAAYYYPWIKVIDGGTGVARFIPPVGHVAGIYARTDIERGVHKAPANAVVRGALGLQLDVSRSDQDILNPRGVNCIRAFQGQGIRVWGARTMSSDPLWKYVNVRRLFNYLEESIEEATQWVVFEPNNERLWSRVRQTISGFLTTVWRDGALMGRTAEEAFFVKCDRTTMTDNDIETGRLIVLIGVAPTRPAEFVIFRIAQWRGGSAIEE